MRPALKLEQEYKSVIEEQVAKQLADAGIAFDYEGITYKFAIPQREAKARPDFPIRHTNIIIEAKGRFGHRGSATAGAEVRQRLILLKQQHPEIDLRILFSSARSANLPIYKGSKTTQGQWATDHGFTWAAGPSIPTTWIKEMKNAQHRSGSAPVTTGKKRAVPSAKQR